MSSCHACSCMYCTMLTPLLHPLPPSLLFPLNWSSSAFLISLSRFTYPLPGKACAGPQPSLGTLALRRGFIPRFPHYPDSCSLNPGARQLQACISGAWLLLLITYSYPLPQTPKPRVCDNMLLSRSLNRVASESEGCSQVCAA